MGLKKNLSFLEEESDTMNLYQELVELQFNEICLFLDKIDNDPVKIQFELNRLNKMRPYIAEETKERLDKILKEAATSTNTSN